MLATALAKKLANHFLHRDFLNINVAHIAGLKDLTSGLSHFRAGHLQLDRHRTLFDHFAEARKIARDLFVERQAENFVARETVDDFVERPIKENFAVIDNEDPVTK